MSGEVTLETWCVSLGTRGVATHPRYRRRIISILLLCSTFLTETMDDVGGR